MRQAGCLTGRIPNCMKELCQDESVSTGQTIAVTLKQTSGLGVVARFTHTNLAHPLHVNFAIAENDGHESYKYLSLHTDVNLRREIIVYNANSQPRSQGLFP